MQRPLPVFHQFPLGKHKGRTTLHPSSIKQANVQFRCSVHLQKTQTMFSNILINVFCSLSIHVSLIKYKLVKNILSEKRDKQNLYLIVAIFLHGAYRPATIPIQMMKKCLGQLRKWYLVQNMTDSLKTLNSNFQMPSILSQPQL